MAGAKPTDWIDYGPAYVDEEDLERRRKRKRPKLVRVKPRRRAKQ
jgi:hypothetical protein